MNLLPLRFRRRRSLDVRKSKSESSKKCSTTERDTDDQTLPEAGHVGFEYSLQVLRRNHALKVGSTSVQDNLRVEARRRDGKLLDERVLERSLGGRDAESAAEGLDDYSDC
jgi:hypothetical protein